MTKLKTSSQKPTWFDSRKYRDKSKLTPQQWYGELSIRKEYLNLLKANRKSLDDYKPFLRLRKNAFATIGADPIIPDSQLMLMLKKDIWSEQGYKSHSAWLTTCQDISRLEIRKDIAEDCKNPNHEYSSLSDTPIDLQFSDIESLHLAHLTINLDAPSSMLKEDVWKIVETMKKRYSRPSSRNEIINSDRRNWAKSNVLEHIDLHLAEIEQGQEFKPSERASWIPPNSESYKVTSASTREKAEALKLLDQQVLDQLRIEIYSANKKADADRRQPTPAQK
jgi:hypothetical protein